MGIIPSQVWPSGPELAQGSVWRRLIVLMEYIDIPRML
jgi:hypothetical protein